ncbi:ADP-ribosylglycohydrolase [Actinobacteria bacterium IMCC26207]|nr:ADP-ribosylglycohydrolase [Actinobacteria bacterium IMCC26207]
MLLCHDEAMETRDSNRSEPNTEPNTDAFSAEQGELSDLVRISLSDRKLLPIGSAPPAQRQLVPSARRIDSARGAMLGTAIGDALGRPAEGRHPAGLRGQEEAFRDFQPWGGYYSGPKGTITDDTQMTMCVAQSLLATRGRIVPEDLARRFVNWLPNGRGTGHTCVTAVNHLQMGENWWTAGVASAGNGAAMRVAPIGIALGADTTPLCHDAALSALITHADPMAVASSVGHAWLIAHLAGANATSLDPTALMNELAAAIEVIDDPGAPEREWNQRTGKTRAVITLANRVREIPALLGKPIGEAFDYLYNGAFVLETLPAALWCFFAYQDDPEEGVINAVLRGHDADTVASMAAAYFGALHGVAAFPDRWTGEDLEYQTQLLNLADQLAAI